MFQTDRWVVISFLSWFAVIGSDFFHSNEVLIHITAGVLYFALYCAVASFLDWCRYSDIPFLLVCSTLGFGVGWGLNEYVGFPTLVLFYLFTCSLLGVVGVFRIIREAREDDECA